MTFWPSRNTGIGSSCLLNKPFRSSMKNTFCIFHKFSVFYKENLRLFYEEDLRIFYGKCLHVFYGEDLFLSSVASGLLWNRSQGFLWNAPPVSSMKVIESILVFYDSLNQSSRISIQRTFLRTSFYGELLPLFLLSPYPSKFLKNYSAAQNLTRC